MSTFEIKVPGARTIRESRDLYVQGGRVTAEVFGLDYTVFAGGFIAAEGRLDGTEGDLSSFFAAKAIEWGAGIDAARNEWADADIEAFEQHVAETARLDESPLQRIRETHGKGGSFRTPSGAFITPADMGLAAMTAQRQHYRLLVAEFGHDRWAVEFIEPDGSLYGRYYYIAG